MNTVNVVMAIGIVIICFLIRREVKHGDLLDELLREEEAKAAKRKLPRPESSDQRRAV